MVVGSNTRNKSRTDYEIAVQEKKEAFIKEYKTL